MNSHLEMIDGPRKGARFPLSESSETLIGRGRECQVILSDAQCSRIHAIVVWHDDVWWIRDAGSRNGTYVNGQKIDEAQLADGHEVRVGSTVFCFHQSAGAEPALSDTATTQTLVFDEQVDPNDTGTFAISVLQDQERAHDLLLLFQLSIKLLGCDEPDEVVQITLDLLHERTKATVVGFLWVSDHGELRPKHVVPPDAARSVSMSRSLTALVCEKGHAVRVGDHTAQSSAESLGHFADSICVPLVHQQKTVGAIHLYLDQGSFSDSDFEVAKSTANIVALALTRARRQASLEADRKRLARDMADTDAIVGESKPMLELISKIKRVARATGCVLIRGESGSGKELVARALHKASPRADRPLLSVNCAAIPADLMESQLFGHKKGSFTSADSDHIGLFEQADSGTLFLDEVGELTLEGQAKLLRILEGHPFLPVGGTKEIEVDVRVIAATNRELRDSVADRRFREDLYYRLSVFELDVPPLRERGNDIELLIHHFLEHFSRHHGRPGLQLSGAALQKLLSYQWPGNIRQLRNVIDSAVVMAEGDAIEVEDMGLRDTGGGELESLRIDHWEHKLIQEALSRTRGNVPEAAKLVGLGRATLYRKIEEYGIER